MISKSRSFHGISLGELVADLEADGLDATGGELRLLGVEAATVGRYHFHDQPVNAALRYSHQVTQGLGSGVCCGWRSA